MFNVRHFREKLLDAKAKSKFDDAVDYLTQNSQFANWLILQLKCSGKAIEVLVSDGEPYARENSWAGPKFDLGNSGGTICWNASRPKEKGNRSAAMGLMHELGHAYQFLSEKQGVKAVMKPRFFGRCYQTGKQQQVVRSAEFIENIEDTNVAAIEQTVATEINASLKQKNAPEELFEQVRESYI